MNIAFEISPLLTASGGFGDKSGVYRYMYGLLGVLSKTMREKNKKARLILFSFNADLLTFPINPDVLKFLDKANISILSNIPAFQTKKITDNAIFNIPLVKSALKVLDGILNLTNLYNRYVNDKKFQIYIEFLKKEFVKHKVELIYHSETGFYPVNGFKNVITIYDLTALMMPKLHREQTVDLQERKLRFTEKYCDGIICISNSTRKDLRKLPGFINRKNIAVIYPGLDQAFEDSPGKKDKNITFNDLNLILKYHKNKVARKKYLLYYGTFEPRKNLIYLVQAFVDLQKSNEIPSDFKLVLMGGEGWGHIKNSIRNFIHENFPIHSKSNIIILDYLNDEYISEFIKNSYAVVYPSIYEGFGLPVLESMALGASVICSKISSLPEVGGNAVLYFDPLSLTDLKEKMKYLVNNPKLASELAKKGIIRINKFSWNKSGIALYEFLKSLIQND